MPALGPFGAHRPDDLRNRLDDVPDHAHGTRGAAAGTEPDQAAEAALQRAAARRQELPEHPDRPNTLPQIKKHRGKKKEKGAYFGPFASARAR
jgi:hypothetical protein